MNSCYGFWNYDLSEGVAAAECAFSDGPQAPGKVDLTKGRAALEGQFPDFQESLREVD